MLETKFKVLFLFAVLAFAAIPIMGILRGTTLTPFEATPDDTAVSTPSGPINPDGVSREEPIQETMVSIPAGPFIRGTNNGGFDERPQRTLVLSAFAIDRYGDVQPVGLGEQDVARKITEWAAALLPERATHDASGESR